VSDFLIIYGQITYDEQFEGTKRCVEEMAPYVDYCIIVCEKQRPFTEEQKKTLLKYPNVILMEEEYRDNLPEFRNIYLNKAREIMKQQGKPAWLCVSDSDEFYSEELRKNLRQLIAEYDAKGYNQLGIRCKERFVVHEWMDEIDILKEIPNTSRESNYYKLLIFKICCDQLRYEGIGIAKRTHETWYCPAHPWRAVYLPPQYTYEHAKSVMQIWRNACLTPDSPILTDRGLIPICEVKVGDKVFSKDGKMHRVAEVWSRYYKGKIVRLRTHYGVWVGLTPDHKIMALSPLQAYQL